MLLWEVPQRYGCGEECVNIADLFSRIDDEPAIAQQYWHCRTETLLG